MSFETIRWEGGWEGHAVIIEQTRLPQEFVELPIQSVEEMFSAIQRLAVRGAPALGVAGAYGMVLALKKCSEDSLLEDLKKYQVYLDSSRPTAVNLSWATAQIFQEAQKANGEGADLQLAVFEKAQSIDRDDRDRCRAIGEHGKHLVPDQGLCLTHCNAGALATAGRGTALSIFYAAHEEGKKFRVFADETRPLLQGSRLTAWELAQAGIDVTVIADNMAAFLMSSQKVDMIVVGADRIAANGDTANKIGTYSLALAAREHQVPFYVAAPVTTFDFSLQDGKEIPIEQRGAEEIREGFGALTAPENVPVWNPAFDVTPHHLIRGFITDQGFIPSDAHRSFEEAFEQIKLYA